MKLASSVKSDHTIHQRSHSSLRNVGYPVSKMLCTRICVSSPSMCVNLTCISLSLALLVSYMCPVDKTSTATPNSLLHVKKLTQFPVQRASQWSPEWLQHNVHLQEENINARNEQESNTDSNKLRSSQKLWWNRKQARMQSQWFACQLQNHKPNEKWILQKLMNFKI